jgi:hypothetical protein
VVEDERVAEAGKLSKLVMEISNALVDPRMLPIQDIPQLLKLAQEVLAVASLMLEPCKRSMPPAPVPEIELWSATVLMTLSYPAYCFFLLE